MQQLVTVQRRATEDRSAYPAPLHSAFMTAVHLLEAGRASMLLRDPVEPVLSIADSVGLDAHLVESVRVPIGQGIAGVVAERGVALVGEIDGQTFLSVPIPGEHGVEGVLNATARLNGKRYTVDDIALAAPAAKHIGDLIQYGRHTARDPVSGLPNRRAFEEMLERELALGERTGSAFSVAFLDLDGLKAINDYYGHAKGDEVISAVGRTLQHILRPYDFAGRFGGDEFVLLLAGDIESDASIVDRIARALDELSREMEISISTSVGVAHWPTDGTTGNDLVSAADRRM